MAEKAIVAFGRYLKLLRERRHLSLDDVAALTKAYPEPVNKGYLSRAERGLSHIGFSKVVALGRAYDIPVDVFAEKWSLDLEVEHLKDPPETEGKTFRDLLEEAGRLSRRGVRVHAYAIWRHLLPRAGLNDLAPNYRDRAEQVAAVALSHSVAAGALGRFRLAQSEAEHVLSLQALGPEFTPVASIHLSVIGRRTGNASLARRFAEQAVCEASASPSQRFLADALAGRALLADLDGQHLEAIELYKKAYAVFRARDRQPEAARTMANLANAYFSVRRMRAARRALDVAARIAKSAGADGIVARTKILLGEIEAEENRSQRATALWLQALEIARRCNDRVAAFKAEFQLFKSALSAGRTNAASAFGRRLNRMWPWIPSDEPEVLEFRSLWLAYRPSKRRAVATSQHPSSR